MFVLWHLFTLARPDYPHTPPTQTHTHTPKHLYTWAQNKKEVWIMLAHGDREAKQSSSWKHREQSPETEESFCEGWREEGKGWSTAALGRGRVGGGGRRSSCSLLSQCPFTHMHKLRHKQTHATVHLTVPASLAANHSKRDLSREGAERRNETDE